MSLLALGRAATMIGLVAGTMICFLTAYRLRDSEPSSLVMVLGLVSLVAALSFARLGVKWLPVIAMAGLAAAIPALLALGGADVLAAGELPTSPFYRAILLEQVLAWAALFGLACLMRKIEGRAVL